MIDFDVELAKIDGKMEKVKGYLAGWETKKAAPGYAKVRPDVQEANEIKVSRISRFCDTGVPKNLYMRK